jgi:hypothetical protein
MATAGTPAVPVAEPGPVAAGGRGAIVIRSDRAVLRAAPLAGEAATPVRVEEVLYLGASTKAVVRLPDGSAGAVRQDARGDEPAPGASAWMCWAPGDAVVVPDHATTGATGAATTEGP